MIIQDDSTQLHITLEEVLGHDLPCAGDLRLSVEVVSPAFRGRNNQVWIDRDVWQRFLSELRMLERDRSGNAELRSLSPADLDLCVAVTDRAGHVAVEGHLGQELPAITGRRSPETRVGFVIELDPPNLAVLLADFGALTSPSTKQGAPPN